MSQSHLYKKFMQFTVTLSEAMDVLTENLEFDGITRVQFNVLQHVATEQPVTLSQICYCQNMSMPNASREIKKLAERGFLYKDTDEKDRRVNYIRLTETGTKLMNAVSDCMEERFFNSISNMPQNDILKLKESLDNLSDSLLNQILDTKKADKQKKS